MKAIYFKRNYNPHDIYKKSYIEGVYFPDKNFVLYKEQRGILNEDLNGNIFSFSRRQDFLDELKSLLEGKIQSINEVTYDNIKEFEYEGGAVLLQNVILEGNLRSNVRSLVENILKQGKLLERNKRKFN